MKARRHPVTLSTEASLNLADDDELLHLMAEAGFDSVFVGIESPNDESLEECGKNNNRNRDLISCIRKIQQAGLEIQGGFIVGFDSDPVSIFDQLAGFIQESGIVTAMVGLLNAPRGTKLYDRLAREGRLLDSISGDNTDASMNFMPKMNSETLLSGYRAVQRRIYASQHYYARVTHFLRNYEPVSRRGFHLDVGQLSAFFKSIVWLGILGKERIHYWKLFFWSLFRRPRLFSLAITYTIYGFHFRKVFEGHLRSHE